MVELNLAINELINDAVSWFKSELDQHRVAPDSRRPTSIEYPGISARQYLIVHQNVNTVQSIFQQLSSNPKEVIHNGSSMNGVCVIKKFGGLLW